MSDPRMDEARALRHGMVHLLASSVAFGVMAVLVRVAARELPSTQIACVRFVGSLLLLLAVARGGGLRPKSGNLPRVLLRGFLGALAIVFYFAAIERIGAGLATLLQCMYPIPTAIIATVFMGETASRHLAAAILVNVLGLVLVLGSGADLGAANLPGILIALLGATFAGAAVATARHLRASEDASLITIYFMAVGTVVTVPSLLAGVAVPSPGVALALAGIVVTSAAGQWLLHHGLGYAPASRGSLASATSVVTSALLEAVLLGTHHGLATWGGAALMMAAVGLASR